MTCISIIKKICHHLNSSPIDELGNWCQERLVGAPPKYKAQQGGFHGNPVSKNQHHHTEGTSVEILSTYLGLTSNKGGKGRVVNLLAKYFENLL